MHDHGCSSNGPCPVPPHPKRLEREMLSANKTTFRRLSSDVPITTPFGLGDGVIFPPEDFPPGVPKAFMKRAAALQPPLRGPLNVLIVLTSYKDMAIRPDAAEYFNTLFFSHGKVKTGSVTEYYEEVSGGRVSITGSIFGPYILPETAEYYSRDGWGFRNAAKSTAPENPNTQTMAGHALDALLKDKPSIDLGPFDNNGRAQGTVDAFIVVHAGIGGEIDGSNPKRDIWSVKWDLKKQRTVGKSNTKVYGFLTIPEDAKVGVSAHEIGHLVFGWPDLYDNSQRTRGVGKWCLMSGGTWGSIQGTEEGTVPCHPSAWCKVQQGWVDLQASKGVKAVLLSDVKGAAVVKGIKASASSKADNTGVVYRLWTNGDANSKEYFLIESRKRYGFDRSLPGEGLLVWHIDDNVEENDFSKSDHLKVTLLNADFKSKGLPVSHKEYKDGEGCPFPGLTKNQTFNATSSPNSHSHSNLDTSVSVTNISDDSRNGVVRMDISVQPPRAKL
ncbi:immune inhibitor A peptidase M6-domain-containing protein [Immersiella caudata]|uniref:Immune inhibitor A peptidase M6-domain-containing protein n=1 Tax=Immersiella caudata TaxID=314043 RepID=A0AA39WSW8_9PEZI|nr:immune inhibitor A peptidase M6-domain-containing protein [Immersiella caudata]